MRNAHLVSWALVVAKWELDNRGDGGDETFLAK